MPSLVSLAEELLAHAKKIDGSLEQNNIPHTSFGKDTLELLPDDAQKLRWDLLDLSHNFRQLIRGARLAGLDIAYSVHFVSLLVSLLILMEASGPSKSSYA
jgi:hypothetical protein